MSAPLPTSLPSRARPSSAPLEALWHRRENDPAAQRQLLSELLRVLRALVGKDLDARGYYLGSDDVDDVVQELLIEVWDKDLNRFDPEKGSLLSFLKTRVRWRVADQVRRLARAKSDSLDEALEEDGFDVVCPLPTPDRCCLNNERRHQLRLVKAVATQALSAMNDDAARTSVQMHDFGGAPLRDVAKALNVHPSNATRARKRGLMRIRNALPAALHQAA